MSHFIRSDGHLTDVALSALADKEEHALDEASLGHLSDCSMCLERLGMQASAQMQLEAQLVLLAAESRKFPWGLVGGSTAMLVTGLVLAGTERIPSVHALGAILLRANRVYSATMGPGVLLMCSVLALVCGAVVVQGAKTKTVRSR